MTKQRNWMISPGHWTC